MTEKKRFAHLHNHTDFSLLDGASKVQRLVDIVADDGNIGVSTNDHGNMGATVSLFKAAQRRGIQAIPGVELYHVPDFSKRKLVSLKMRKSRFHLNAMAINMAGYQNLMRMTSHAQLSQFHGKPIVDDSNLDMWNEGIIITSGCIGSFINQTLLQFGEEEAERLIERYSNMFENRFFLEVADHGIEEQYQINDFLRKMHIKKGLPLLAANDSHYDEQGDAPCHEIMLCIGTGTTMGDPDRFKFSANENYLKSYDKMAQLFPESKYPGAIENTARIVDMCDGLDIFEGKKYLIPEYPASEKELEFSVPHNPLIAKIDFGDEQKEPRELIDFFIEKVYEGLILRYSEEMSEEVIDRAAYEISVVMNMGFVSYLLILWDVINWSRDQKIMVGPGRGSAAGSICLYALFVTAIDPIRHKLYFERFLNPDRLSMPDVDIDVEKQRRHEVVEYVREKYGHDRVSYIATYGTLQPKNAIKDAARVMQHPVSFGDEIARMFPDPVGGRNVPIKKIVADRLPSDEKERGKIEKQYHAASDFRRRYKDDEDARKVIDTASWLEGRNRQLGTHAAGILITPGPLSDYVPLVRKVKGKDGDMGVCSYYKDDLEYIGGLKMDFLGLRNLTVIGDALHYIERDLKKVVDIENLPHDDQDVFKMLAEGHTDGVFQLESDGMRDLLKRINPDRFDDITAVLALYRPGPLGSNLHINYADIKNGRAKAHPPHPEFEELFEETYSVLTYQEQLIQIAIHFGGFSASEADMFRRATGKKDADVLEAQRVPFVEGAIAKGYDPDAVEKIWEMIPPFSDYSFNKSHAAAYAEISWRTAWLKHHYAAQFVAACINGLPKEKVPSQVRAAQQQGVLVKTPDINKSDVMPVTSEDEVWLGLKGIHQCGEAVLDSIVSERRTGGNFEDVFDFVSRCRKVTSSALASLVGAGCFDSLHSSRRGIIEQIDEFMGPLKEIGKATSQIEDDDILFGTEEIDNAASAIDGIREKIDLDIPEYSRTEIIRREVEALGFVAGEHPFLAIEPAINKAMEDGSLPENVHTMQTLPEKDGVRIALLAMASRVKVGTTKKGKPKMDIALDDGHGNEIIARIFDENLPSVSPGSIVVVDGRLREDTFGQNEESNDEYADDGMGSGHTKSWNIMGSNVITLDLEKLEDGEAQMLDQFDAIEFAGRKKKKKPVVAPNPRRPKKRRVATLTGIHIPASDGTVGFIKEFVKMQSVLRQGDFKIQVAIPNGDLMDFYIENDKKSVSMIKSAMKRHGMVYERIEGIV